MPADPNDYKQYFGNAPPAQAPSNKIEQYREMLLRHFMDKIAGPEPAPPQYQPQQLTPFQGMAMARNPQMAGQMMQYAQGPAQAQYMNQQAAFEQAMAGRKEAMAGGIALLGQEQKQQIDPLGLARLQETMRHNRIQEGKQQKQDKPREQIITDEFGHQWVYNLDTGEKRDTGFTKQPDQATQAEMRISALVKDRMERAKQLIDSGLTTPRGVRVFERGAAADPTGITSGSDFAANARTYKNLVTELGSLTRGLYGAQGIRSYQEIQNLINVAPPWSSGDTAIKQWYENMDAAIKIADTELQRAHPYLAGVGKTPAQVDVPSAGETKDQMKARILAKHGVQ